MTDPSDDELDTMLARGRMSGAARERVLEKVLHATSPRSVRRLRATAITTAITALAAAAALMLWLRSGHDEFTPKGAPATTIGLDATCLEGACRAGGTLVLRIDDVPERAHLAVYATREGASDASARIWYFPEADGTAPALAAQPGSQLVKRGITLGPEHTAGRYQVHAVIGKRPLTREGALDHANRDVIARATRVLEVAP